MQRIHYQIIYGLKIGAITTFFMVLFSTVYSIITGFFDYLYIEELLFLGICTPILESIVFFIPNFLGGLLSKHILIKRSQWNWILVGLASSVAVMTILTLMLLFDIDYGWRKINEYLNQATLYGSMDGLFFFLTYLFIIRKSRMAKTKPEL